jgi:hypothetical protein
MYAALRSAQKDYSESKLLHEGMRLERELASARERIKQLEESYSDLVMQVERKFDGETRHETAKRYIMNAEILTQESKETKEAKP